MAEQEARHGVGGVGEAVLHVLGEVREVCHWPEPRRCVSMLLSVVFLARRWSGEATGWGFNGASPLVCIYTSSWGGRRMRMGNGEMIRPNHYISIDG